MNKSFKINLLNLTGGARQPEPVPAQDTRTPRQRSRDFLSSYDVINERYEGSDKNEILELIKEKGGKSGVESTSGAQIGLHNTINPVAIKNRDVTDRISTGWQGTTGIPNTGAAEAHTLGTAATGGILVSGPARPDGSFGEGLTENMKLLNVKYT